MNSSKYRIAIASKQYLAIWILYCFTTGECFVRFAVCFLVYTLLVWGRGELTVGVWSQKWGSITVLGLLGGCKNITVCNANANLPGAIKFQDSIFSTLQMPPLHSTARGACPGFAPFPPPLYKEWDILTIGKLCMRQTMFHIGWCWDCVDVGTTGENFQKLSCPCS